MNEWMNEWRLNESTAIDKHSEFWWGDVSFYIPVSTTILWDVC